MYFHAIFDCFAFYVESDEMNYPTKETTSCVALSLFTRRPLCLFRGKDGNPGRSSRACSCHFLPGREDPIWGLPSLPPPEEPPAPDEDDSWCCPIEEDEPQVQSAQPEKSTPEEEKQEQQEDVSAGVSTRSGRSRIASMEERLETALAELKALRDQQAQGHRYSAALQTAEVLQVETGVADRETFNWLVDAVVRAQRDTALWRVPTALSDADTTFLTLMKLRHNYNTHHLAGIFSCSIATVSRVVNMHVPILHRVLCEDKSKLTRGPPQQQQQQQQRSEPRKSSVPHGDAATDYDDCLDVVSSAEAMALCRKLFPRRAPVVRASGDSSIVVGEEPLLLRFLPPGVRLFKILDSLPYGLRRSADMVLRLCCTLATLKRPPE